MKKQGTTLSKLIIPLIIAAIVVYLIFSAWMGLRDPYTFVIAYTCLLYTSPSPRDS